jgi:uncharacterized protein
MSTATIAVNGDASREYPADDASVYFHHQFTAPARSSALAHGNAVVTQLREYANQIDSGVREMKIRAVGVNENFSGTGSERVHEPSGWTAQVVGEAFADPESVPVVVAGLIKLGVSIGQVAWLLKPETEADARRQVRRLAVDKALEAANDFADALGGTVGRLIALADPGLLGSGAVQGSWRGPARAGGAYFSAASISAAPWDERIDIDSSTIMVTASVEASYEVNLD